MLCNVCQIATTARSDVGLNKGERGVVNSSRQVYKHHRTFESFKLAVDSGCSIFNLLWYTYHDENASSKTELSKGCSINHMFEYLIHDTRCWTFEISPTREYWTRQFIKLVLFEDKSDLKYDAVEPESIHTFAPHDQKQVLDEINHRIETSTDSQDCVNLASYWLSTCEANHPKCRAANPIQHALPLRVIDVGSLGESSVRLFVSDVSSTYAKYLALSHCWGKANILRLTLDNEHTLRKGFAIHNLPKTFRQAIHFTRALSIRYLWIDSLCIIQDSVTDWKQQSALMGNIYRHCYCNIAATKSHDGSGGLFTTREPRSMKPLRLPLEIEFIGRHNDRKYEVYYCWKDGAWEDLIEHGPLNSRGWVLQERLLSPRVLHFSDYIFWECRSLSAYEITPTGKPDRDCHGDGHRFYTNLMQAIDELSTENQSLIHGGPDPTVKARTAWCELVSKYSKCQLSNESDVLITISGIAKVVERAINDEYVVGLWRSTLLKDILWATEHRSSPNSNESRSTRPFPSRAPTWSWAPIKGEIRGGFKLTDDIYGGYNTSVSLCYIAEIVEIHMKATGDDLTANIGMEHLSIRGSLLDVGFGKIGMPWLSSSPYNFLVRIGRYRFCGISYIDDVESMKNRTDRSFTCMPISMPTRMDGPRERTGMSFQTPDLLGLLLAPVEERHARSACALDGERCSDGHYAGKDVVYQHVYERERSSSSLSGSRSTRILSDKV